MGIRSRRDLGNIRSAPHMFALFRWDYHTTAILNGIHFQVIYVDTGDSFQSPGVIAAFGQKKVAAEKSADHEVSNCLLSRLVGNMQNTT